MNGREKRAIANYLKMLDGHELQEILSQVNDEIEQQYWSDENFYLRDKTDDYIYITRYKDGSYHYDYIGKKAYEKYLKDENCIEVGFKTKDLFPSYGTLLVKGV